MENNTSVITVDIAGYCADVAVYKTASSPDIRPGDCLTYTLQIINYGPDTAKGVLVTDTIPPQILNPIFAVEDGPATPWEGSYYVGDMPKGSTVTIKIAGRVNPKITSAITNTAVVSAQTRDPDMSNNTSYVRSCLRLTRYSGIEL